MALGGAVGCGERGERGETVRGMRGMRRHSKPLIMSIAVAQSAHHRYPMAAARLPPWKMLIIPSRGVTGVPLQVAVPVAISRPWPKIGLHLGWCDGESWLSGATPTYGPLVQVVRVLAKG